MATLFKLLAAALAAVIILVVSFYGTTLAMSYLYAVDGADSVLVCKSWWPNKYA